MQEDRGPESVRADAEALDWLVSLQENPEDAALRRRFELWRTANPVNAAAWEETAQVYAGIGETRPAHPDRWRELAEGRRPMLAPPIIAARRRRRLRPMPSGKRPRRKVATVALPAAAAAALAFVAAPDLVLRWRADAITGAGELRDVRLSDGSLASLGPGSAIGIDYSHAERRITLLRGQAFFDVRHDEHRPFRVAARDVETTDIGTAFEVRLDTEATHVGVEHGIVRVDYAKASPSISERLTAGQMVTIPLSGSPTREAEPPNLVASWRQGQLAVQGRPMSEVIDAIRPWYSGIILVRSDTLADRRVTGVYDFRDPAGAMVALAKAYGGHVTRITPWLMIISDG